MLLQAVLAAINAVADDLGEFLKESTALSRQVMQIVLGFWTQDKPNTFPVAVEDALYDQIVSALVVLVYSFMSTLEEHEAQVCRTTHACLA